MAPYMLLFGAKVSNYFYELQILGQKNVRNHHFDGF